MSNSTIRKRINQKAKTARTKLAEVGKEVESLISLTENLENQLSDANNKLIASAYPGLNFLSIRAALCDLVSNKDNSWIPSILATCGNGPWEEDEFDSFLKKNGITLYSIPSDDIDGLVVGFSGWSEDLLSEQIFERDSNNLKIYTQELFVLGIVFGKDPYEVLEQKVIDEVGVNHPAIQFLLNNSFTWPWSDRNEDSNTDSDWDDSEVDWAHESVLKQSGYSASTNGPTESERRRILTKVFESSRLPGIENSEQRNRWGSGKSARRLHAISHFLGWLINLQGSEKPAARQKWVSDLTWLKKEFYGKAMSFSWPQLTQEVESTKIHAKTNNQLTPIKSALPGFNSNERSQAKFLYPKYELATMIGNKPVASVGKAVELVNEYIKRNNLIRAGNNFIQTDANLHAMTGNHWIDKKDLPDYVSRYLRQ